MADSTDVGADDGRGGEEIDEGTAKRPPASVAWDVVPYCRAVLTITIGRVMNDWHDGGWGPGAWVAMGLMMLVFWGLVAAVVVYVIRNVGHRPDSHAGGDRPRQDQALQILDERFARGEIDADDYRARRDLLRSS